MPDPKTYDASSYLILSIKWSRGGVLTWWGPNNSGYVTDLHSAGVYSAEQVAANPGYYDDERRGTKAVPYEDVMSGKFAKLKLVAEGTIHWSARTREDE